MRETHPPASEGGFRVRSRTDKFGWRSMSIGSIWLDGLSLKEQVEGSGYTRSEDEYP
jgi:hypothetical protein